MTTLPLLVVGDSPRRTTGLARIARDLTARLVGASQAGALAITVAQAGPDSGEGRHWTAWPFFGMPVVSDDWGGGTLGAIWRDAFGRTPGVVLTVWDPARCYALLQTADLPAGTAWWGYCPIDAATRSGTFGGPAADAVRRYDRVLAYTRWGSRVLAGVTGHKVPYLPHGIDLTTFAPNVTAEEYAEARTTLGPRVDTDTVVIGCVAANQPRKDLGVWAAAIALLRERGWPVHAWLHTDALVGPGEYRWSVPELLEQAGLLKHATVTLERTDRQLAALYALCLATIAPGLGEGFGYPIVESLACGVPVVHGTYGGGAELVPRQEWRFPQIASRTESIYAVERPVYHAEDVANAAERALQWMRQEAHVARPYCRGAVAHLGWDHLWPRWHSWVAAGVRAW